MNPLTQRNCEIEYFDIDTDASHIELGECILKHISTQDFYTKTPIILCIGTDRATGDCLGPLVGEQLQQLGIKYKIFGNNRDLRRRSLIKSHSKPAACTDAK